MEDGSILKTAQENAIYFNNMIKQKFLSHPNVGEVRHIGLVNAIEIVKDRTNHTNDKLISDFWNTYNDYASVNENVITLIKKLKANNYGVYLLSNINPYMYDFVKPSGLFDIVDGYALSYLEHKVKPNESIYNLERKTHYL